MRRLRVRPRRGQDSTRPPYTVRQRLYLTVAAVIASLFVLSILWVVVTGLVARAQLESVRSELQRYQSALSDGRFEQARAIGQQIGAHAGNAHQLTSGPAWWVGANLLGVGTPLRTTRATALAADEIARAALPVLPRLVADVTGGRSTGPGSFDLSRLSDASTAIHRVRRVVRTETMRLSATPPSWFGPVAGGRATLLSKLESIDGQLSSADRTVRALLPMLGSNGPQRYFVGFLNEAESRSLGGLPGAYAIMTADDGRLSFEHFGSDNDFKGVRADVDLGAQYQALYGQDDPTGVFQNSTISPDFPDAARIWAGMWRARTGERIDGAVAIDPSALAYLMQVTGPATLGDGTQVSAGNVAELAQSGQYVRYPGISSAANLERKRFLSSVAQAVSGKLLEVGSPVDLLAPLRRGVQERRILLWSAHPTLERTILGSGHGSNPGGVLQPGDSPFSAFFVNNATGGKMDYYLQRSMVYRERGCGAHRTATARFTMYNDTPSYPLPPYVTYVSGGRPAGTRAGFTRLIVSYYATPGARVTSVAVDGKAQTVASTTEGSLTTVRLLVELPAGARRTVTVGTSEPDVTGPVQIVRQPLVQPLRVRSAAADCPAPSATPAGPAVAGRWWSIAALFVVLIVLVVLFRRRSRAN